MTTAADGAPGRAEPGEDFGTLPARVPLEKTIASVEADPVPDPHGGRNVDQHLALRED